MIEFNFFNLSFRIKITEINYYSLFLYFLLYFLAANSFSNFFYFVIALNPFSGFLEWSLEFFSEVLT